MRLESSNPAELSTPWCDVKIQLASQAEFKTCKVEKQNEWRGRQERDGAEREVIQTGVSAPDQVSPGREWKGLGMGALALSGLQWPKQDLKPLPRASSGPGLASGREGGSGTSCRMAGRVGWLLVLLCAQPGTTSSHSIALGPSSYRAFANSTVKEYGGVGASHSEQVCVWQGQALNKQITRERWGQQGPLPRPGLLVGGSWV